MKVIHLNDDVYRIEDLEFKGRKYTDVISLSGAEKNIASQENEDRKSLKKAFVKAITEFQKKKENPGGSKSDKRIGKDDDKHRRERILLPEDQAGGKAPDNKETFEEG